MRILTAQAILDALAAAAAVVLMVFGSGPVAAQIVINNADIAGQVKAGVECYLHPNGPGCPPSCNPNTDSNCKKPPNCWFRSDKQVIVSKLAKNKLNADIYLKCERNNIPNPTVTIKVDLVFTCLWRTPSVRVAADDVTFDINFPWWFDIVTAGVSAFKADVREMAEREKFIAEGSARLFFSDMPTPLSWCPEIEVQPNGDVHVNLGQGGDCKNDEERFQACGKNETGPGITDICVGGRWGRLHGDCERRPPPGGQNK